MIKIVTETIRRIKRVSGKRIRPAIFRIQNRSVRHSINVLDKKKKKQYAVFWEESYRGGG
jgi:hypothetical protein